MFPAIRVTLPLVTTSTGTKAGGMIKASFRSMHGARPAMHLDQQPSPQTPPSIIEFLNTRVVSRPDPTETLEPEMRLQPKEMRLPHLSRPRALSGGNLLLPCVLFLIAVTGFLRLHAVFLTNIQSLAY